MGLIKGFLAANTLGKVAFLTLLVAELFNWLCFTMSEWGLMDTDVENDDNKIGYGVWRLCGNQEPDPNCQDLDGWRLAWYGAFQAYCIFGFVGVNVAFVLMVLMLFVPQCIENREMGFFCSMSSFAAAVCYTIALIIFGANWDSTYDRGFDRETFGSGFFLAIIVVLLSVVAGICAIIGVRGKQQVASSSPGERKQQGPAASSSVERNQQAAVSFSSETK